MSVGVEWTVGERYGPDVHSAFPYTPFKLHGFHATGAATAFAIRPRQRKATVTIEINVRIPLLDLRKLKSAACAGIQENPSPSAAAKSVIYRIIPRSLCSINLMISVISSV